ncbi:MAG: glutamate--cysteine ligase, partial [Gammaproteobacteria bacterium]|nr:glutamate--cysteine ligase [Gammaproteobacteria bacterium]
VEIRSLDINIFDPSGINQNTMRFIEAFLIYCMLEDSPKLDSVELDAIRHNHSGVAKRGRDPELRLREKGEAVTLQSWATRILANVSAVAELIDRHQGDDSYSAAVSSLQAFVDHPDATLSARIVAELEQSGSSYFEFALGMAKCHRDYFSAIAPLREEQAQILAEEAAASHVRQAAIEAADDIGLDEYLQRYFTAC